MTPKLDIRFLRFFFIRGSIASADVKSAFLVYVDPIKDFEGIGYTKSKRMGIGLISNAGVGLLIETKDSKLITFNIADLDRFMNECGNFSFKIQNENYSNIGKLKDVVLAIK